MNTDVLLGAVLTASLLLGILGSTEREFSPALRVLFGWCAMLSFLSLLVVLLPLISGVRV